MGRILAMKVRTYAYNSMLGQAKAGMKFQNEKSDTWELVPANDVSGVDSRTQKMAAQAKEFLERVVADHPGTPWALIAEEELENPIGYRWEERHTGVNNPSMKAGNNNHWNASFGMVTIRSSRSPFLSLSSLSTRSPVRIFRGSSR